MKQYYQDIYGILHTLEVDDDAVSFSVNAACPYCANRWIRVIDLGLEPHFKCSQRPDFRPEYDVVHYDIPPKTFYIKPSVTVKVVYDQR